MLDGRLGVATDRDDRGCCTPFLVAPLDAGEAADLAEAFAALADPVRLQLLSLIAAAGEVCACDLMAPVGRSQPTVSHHTKILAAAGLIVGEKRGRWVWWSLVPERAAALRDALVVRTGARA
jgi:ArsR family transcriptional regulator, arsenate/arsenite/antimonite-responsive transcriptional repressor